MKNHLLKKERYLKKHVSTIHVDSKLSFLDKKLSNVLLLNAYDNLPNNEQHRIDVKTLCSMLGFDSKNLDHLKQSITHLVVTPVSWDILDDDDGEWGVSTLLASGVIKKGICTYEYSSALSKKLYRPDIYARINLGIQNEFSGVYSLTLYENCLRFISVGSTGWISIVDFRRLMGVSDIDLYSTYKRLNERIIKPATKEINQVSNIKIEPETKREGRSISHIKFTVKHNNQFSFDLPSHNGFKNNEVYRKLIGLGISEKLAIQWLTDYDEDHILEKLEYANKRDSKGRIKENKSGFIRAAIEGDFKDPDLVAKQVADSKRAKKNQAEEKERLKAKLVALESAAIDNINTAKIEIFKKSLPIEDIQNIEEAALNTEIAKIMLGQTSGEVTKKRVIRGYYLTEYVNNHKFSDEEIAQINAKAEEL